MRARRHSSLAVWVVLVLGLLWLFVVIPLAMLLSPHEHPVPGDARTVIRR